MENLVDVSTLREVEITVEVLVVVLLVVIVDVPFGSVEFRALTPPIIAAATRMPLPP